MVKIPIHSVILSIISPRGVSCKCYSCRRLWNLGWGKE